MGQDFFDMRCVKVVLTFLNVKEDMLRFKHVLKVIRKFFLNHNKSFRWHLGDYEKHDFFPFEGL